MDGQPFFPVTRPIDPGTLTVLREEIVPFLHRFGLASLQELTATSLSSSPTTQPLI
jgi:hypothetical protein